jgi:hypothetical protein
MRSDHRFSVMPAQSHPAALRGGDPVFAGIHVFPLPTLPRMRGRVGRGKTWMAGTSPALTTENDSR